MSWGHAISSDLACWDQLPIAIPEDQSGAIFTGSSVADPENTSSLYQSGGGCVVSVYTGFTEKTVTLLPRQIENLAFSQDGRTWTKYSGHPVLDFGLSDSRDPKVFWYALANQWVLVIIPATEKKVRLFGSSNLKQWHQLSGFSPQGAVGGVWKCPDLYSLPVKGRPDQTRWILKVGLNPGHISDGFREQLNLGSEPLQLHIFIDYSSVKMFAQDGRVVMTNLVFPSRPAPVCGSVRPGCR